MRLINRTSKISLIDERKLVDKIWLLQPSSRFNGKFWLCALTNQNFELVSTVNAQKNEGLFFAEE